MEYFYRTMAVGALICIIADAVLTGIGISKYKNQSYYHASRYFIVSAFGIVFISPLFAGPLDTESGFALGVGIGAVLYFATVCFFTGYFAMAVRPYMREYGRYIDEKIDRDHQSGPTKSEIHETRVRMGYSKYALEREGFLNEYEERAVYTKWREIQREYYHDPIECLRMYKYKK